MKAMDILAGDHRQRFFGFSSFSLDGYYIDSSPREPCFVLVPLRFASEAWPRAGLGAPRMPTNLLHHGPKNRAEKSAQNMAAIERPRQYEEGFPRGTGRPSMKNCRQ